MATACPERGWLVADQRIMPLDEQDRRKVVEAQAIAPLQATLDDAHLRQIIAANIDQLLIVAAWLEPKLWLQLLDADLPD